MNEQRPVPPQYPTTATLMLLADRGDPFQRTSAQAASARQVITDLLQLLPADQREFGEQFEPAAHALAHAVATLNTWQLSPQEATVLTLPTVPSWGEAPMLEDVWVGREPPRLTGEAVYGFQGAITPLLAHLLNAIRNLEQGSYAYGAGLRRVMLAAAVAEFAARVEAAVSIYTAAVWDFERPSMPTGAVSSARVELRSSPRAHPQARWARAARVLFLPGRMEITTADGLEVIGDQVPIAGLMHVVPPSPRAVLTAYDPAERYTRLALQDELGAVHLCDADGYSLGAIAVADWLSQPELQIAQQVATIAGERPMAARDRLVWGLQVSGIVDGAAVLGVPIRRGVMHPPSRAPITTGTPATSSPPATPGYQPRALIRLLRPAPHHQPYRGTAAKPQAAHKRRQQRLKTWRKDTGPGSVINHVVRGAAPAAIWIGGLGSAYLFAETIWARVCLLWAIVAVLEPWLWWVFEHLRDRHPRRMTAAYRPGRYPGGSRAFAGRAALLFDGTNIGVRGPQGHIAWAAGPSDAHLGVVAVHRLMDGGMPWAIALVDHGGRWRFVLPIAQWVPSGDLGGLAGFAKAAGLTVADAQAHQVPVTEDVFDERTQSTQQPSFGPPTRGMVILAGWCLMVVPLTLAGSRLATFTLLALAAVATVPAAARWLWHRMLARRTPVN
ncbi:hypothetical protein [Ruania zhangjianzhongii]|uniref:hypothetical protein n=1 Tax=Ruania zhangjianzhongii TaxID=2603206 RepID=UPI0011CAD82E|nr:hypothetical protein [Ruania zhangjianzhongii]